MQGDPVPVATVKRVQFSTNGVAAPSPVGPVDGVAEKRGICARSPSVTATFCSGQGIRQ